MGQGTDLDTLREEQRFLIAKLHEAVNQVLSLSTNNVEGEPLFDVIQKVYEVSSYLFENTQKQRELQKPPDLGDPI